MKGMDKKKLLVGFVLMASFLVVLVLIFMPLIDGTNSLNYLDTLYNSISKASANYIDEVQAEVDQQGSVMIDLDVDVGDPALAAVSARLLQAAGATAAADDAGVAIVGDLQAILSRCLADTRSAYHNRGDEIDARYQLEAKAALFAWWRTLSSTEKVLTGEKRFSEATVIHTVRTRALECAYNYYGITPQPISERWGIVFLSLAFYVLYTVWYGYAVMYLFEGLGLKIGH